MTSAGAAEVRIGVVVFSDHTEAAALTPDGDLLAIARGTAEGGVERRVGEVLRSLLGDGAIDRAAVAALIFAGSPTTAALENTEELLPVAVVRIASPARSAMPPLTGWPEQLRAACDAGTTIVAGGRDVGGGTLATLDDGALRQFFRGRRGVAEAIAITGTFSAVTPEDEEVAATIAAATLPGLPVVLSHEIGMLRLLERENATVLNAALAGAGSSVVAALDASLAREGIEAPIYFVRNDGTLLPRERAARSPLLVAAGGTASRLLGAATLAGVEEALVCVVDGDSATLGSVYAGRPVEAGGRHRIAEVPASVSYPATIELGSAIGPRARWERCLEAAVARLQDAVRPMPLVAVGEGSDTVPGELDRVERVLRPEAGSVAAAVGAALAPIGITVERVLPRSGASSERREEIAAQAVSLVVQSGADASRTSVVELQEVPMPYLPNTAVCVRARAEGPLQPPTRSDRSTAARQAS
jgi:N-methylhydantoinase A/oxoprolinase/acetone carboxylase beta subunit